MSEGGRTGRRLAGALVAVVVLGLLGACSGDDDEGGVVTTTPTTPTTTFTSPTTGLPPTSTCADQNFTPNTEDIAADIVATGLSCAEAEAFVRKVGPLVGVGGPSNIAVDGFACVLTRDSDGPGLPSSDYECTSGAKTVTFHRT